MTKPCSTPGCHTLTKAKHGRCARCQSERDRVRNQRRTHYRGDYRRRAAVVRGGAQFCWLCGEPARVGDPWQADHVVPGDPESVLAPAHRSCNARRGNRLEG